MSPSSEGKVLGTCAAELRDPQYACLCFIWNDRYPRSLTGCGGDPKMRGSLPGHTARSLEGRRAQPASLPDFPSLLAFFRASFPSILSLPFLFMSSRGLHIHFLLSVATSLSTCAPATLKSSLSSFSTFFFHPLRPRSLVAGTDPSWLLILLN